MNTEKIIDDKQCIKKKRTKKYFINATKEIIINEGVENVSVRKIAEIAGYSYTTIYNYYADLNELLLDVREVMFIDQSEYLQKKMRRITMDVQGLKLLLKTCCTYHFENPNIFKFLFLYQISKINDTSGEGESKPYFYETWQEVFNGFVLEEKLMDKDIEVLAKIFIYSMHGMMTLSFSDKGNLSEENIYRDLESIVDYLLKKE